MTEYPLLFIIFNTNHIICSIYVVNATNSVVFCYFLYSNVIMQTVYVCKTNKYKINNDMLPEFVIVRLVFRQNQLSCKNFSLHLDYILACPC